MDEFDNLDMQVRGYLEFGGEIKRILSFKELSPLRKFIKYLPQGSQRAQCIDYNNIYSL